MPDNLARQPSLIIVTPAPRGSRAGNRTTALRWAALLRQLGARVRIVEQWQGQTCNMLFAVHAAKTAASVIAFAAACPDLPVAVLLAGTDVYPKFEPEVETQRVLELANTLITLQPRTIDVVPEALRHKVRTIVQSATAVQGDRPDDRFAACVLAHLRPVKEPLLPFAAMQKVPRNLPVEVVLAGRALAPEIAEAVQVIGLADRRCRWIGELSRARAKALLASSHACIVPSAGEGGANVVSEALAAGTPLLASRIPGNTGLLGDDWPGLFDAGDVGALAQLLIRSASDSVFYQSLVDRAHALRDLVDPARERDSLRELLAELLPP